jgi:outer membrane protein assembly factor BamB
VTAGGLIFAATSTDRKLRAYDQDNGRILWEKEVPSAPEGIPAVYEVNGRQYIAFCVAGGNGLQPPRVGTRTPPGPGQYMVRFPRASARRIASPFPYVKRSQGHQAAVGERGGPLPQRTAG